MAIWTSGEPVSPSCLALPWMISVFCSWTSIRPAWPFSGYLSVVVLPECNTPVSRPAIKLLHRYLVQDRPEVRVLVGDRAQLLRRARRKGHYFDPDTLALHELANPAEVTVARQEDDYVEAIGHRQDVD